jgi:hypothetical protein
MTKKSPWRHKAERARPARRADAAYNLHLSDDGKGTKRITVPNVIAFRDRLGKGVTEAFFRCFVHTERLSALADWIRVLNKHEDPEAITTRRDLWTVLWFAVGTLKTDRES